MIMPVSFQPRRPGANAELFSCFPQGPLGLRHGVAWRWWLIPAMGLATVNLALAQEALQSSLAGDAAAEARNLQLQSMAYTVKYGDFKLLVTPSLALNWNDNITLVKDDPESDFILSPLVALDASYPIGTRNLLDLSVDFGYNKYVTYDQYSQWYLGSGSGLSFDVYVKDFWFNVHDRFQYTQDSAQESAVAGTGSYGTFQNTAGLSGTWDLKKITLTLGYDHQNVQSLSSQYDQINSASELLVAQAGLQVHPKVTIGVEGSASFMTYEETVLNNNQVYSAGIYGDLRPGHYFSVQPRFGYTIFDCSQTSSSVQGGNLNSWYAELTLKHQATEFLNYTLSAGHEILPGVQSDAIQDTYVRPAVNWNLTRKVTLQTSGFFEHGDESAGQQASWLEDNYNWYGGALSLSYSPAKKVRVSLNYRLTMRSSNESSNEYTQNQIGLQITYTPP
jgi:hypothetical protein